MSTVLILISFVHDYHEGKMEISNTFFDNLKKLTVLPDKILHLTRLLYFLFLNKKSFF